MEAISTTNQINLNPMVEFSARVPQAISDIAGEKVDVQRALNVILRTFSLVSAQRKGPWSRVTPFSVNIGDKGRVYLIQLEAVTQGGVETRFVSIDLPGQKGKAFNAEIF
jgi:hypothetical protein